MSAKAVDFKKKERELYAPGDEPALVQVPEFRFIMLDGSGDPNGGFFMESIQMLYGLSFTMKMSNKRGLQPEGYYEYVTPPLEGLWWVEGGDFDFSRRDNWRWTLMIRQPEFYDADFFGWACRDYKGRKPGLEVSRMRFDRFLEGKAVQLMHRGPYSEELASLEKVSSFIKAHGLTDLVGKGGFHHEIYLYGAEKGDTGTMRTILRHPVR